MAVNRIGFSSDFTLKNQKVGVGSADPTATLDVRGAIKGDFNVSGATTLTSYGGFAPQKQFVNENLTLTGDYNTVSEDIIVGLGKTFTISAGSSVSIGTLKNVSIGTHFSVPNGGTSARTDSPVEGMVRFNDDLNTLEFWNGYEWRQFNVTGASGRGVFSGGSTPTVSISSISYINISSTGNALNFGTLSTAARIDSGSFSNSTRGVFHLGVASPIAETNILEYITIASEGNSIDFGDLTVARNRTSALSNSTRGIVAGGFTPSPTNTYFNILDYIQIQTLGNALDFGDLQNLTIRPGCVSSPTRGIFVGGLTPSTNLNSISFVNISSTGNAVDFGGTNIFSGSYIAGGVSNGVRGIIAGGESAGSGKRKDIAYLTIASTGNAIYFGDLTIAKSHLSGCSSATRGVYVGGDTPSYQNTLEYITIASTGNAVDFGDDVIAASRRGACSDSHGGLGGF
jgi:hypothetical protein